MNGTNRWEGKNRKVWPFFACARLRLRRILKLAPAVLLASCLVAEARGETPKAADFPELAAANRPVQRFVSGLNVLVGEGDPRSAHDPIPAEARILAFQDSRYYLCATADTSHVIGSRQGLSGQHEKPALARRFLFLKPSVYVVDDLVSGAAPDEPVRWLLRFRREPKVAGRQLRIADGDDELVCETLWPLAETLQRSPGTANTSESVFQVQVPRETGAETVRCLHVLHLRPAGDARAATESVLENVDGRLQLAITTSDRTFRLSLPPPGADGGHISVEAADGQKLIPRRHLPGGVLPHGPEGNRLIERWDRGYRDGRRPSWDAGVPAPVLKQAVEEQVIRPSRTAVLGCGSGTNAIYLASQGFDVTAIDIAPTALSIAEAKANEAGVQVRWLLADVLALPDLEPFDLIFDRGCYHNVRYVDAAAFVDSVRRISRPGTRFLLLSLNRDGPPGVREHHMRDDLSSLIQFEWLRKSGTEGQGAGPERPRWSAMLHRKGID